MQGRWTSGEAYESYVGRWSRQIARGFLPWLGAERELRWLDLGSGTGVLVSRILEGCAPLSVVGVEPSDAFRELAQKSVTDRRARFLKGDGAAIPLGDGAVECAVSGLVLNFIPDKARAMSELVRVVAPGGIVAAYVWDYAGHVQFMRHFWDAALALDPEVATHDEGLRFPICRPQALEALFAGAGLARVAIAPIDIVTPFADFDDYWSPFLGGTGVAPAYCMSLAEDRREALRARLAASLPSDPDGRILLAARAWAVRGVRPGA